MTRSGVFLTLAAIAALFSLGAAQAETISMVPVGNPGNNANYYGSPFPIDSPYYTTVVGEFQLSDSPYGTFDQGGNVWEWNETAFSPSSRGLRGGSFGYISDFLLASTRGNSPTYEDYTIGFRVASSAAVPEPGSLAMLVGIAVMGLRFAILAAAAGLSFVLFLFYPFPLRRRL